MGSATRQPVRILRGKGVILRCCVMLFCYVVAMLLCAVMSCYAMLQPSRGKSFVLRKCVFVVLSHLFTGHGGDAGDGDNDVSHT